MKSLSFFMSILSLLLTTVAHSQSGGNSLKSGRVSDGGGALEEMDFKFRSQALESLLRDHPDQVKEHLGLEASTLVAAIQSTKGLCATGDLLKTIQKEGKLFWFQSSQNLIGMDCANYFSKLNASPEIVIKGLFVHEYARKAAGETEHYEFSGNAESLFTDLAETDSTALGSPAERFARIFSIGYSVQKYVAEVQNQMREQKFRSEITADIDRIYCFTPTTVLWNIPFVAHISVGSGTVGANAEEVLPKNRTPKNYWDAKYFKNSATERCAKYKVETYKSDEELMTYLASLRPAEYDAGYIPTLPQIRRDHLNKKAIKDIHAPAIQALFQKAAEELRKISSSNSKSKSLTEISMAIAIRKTLVDKVANGKLFAFGFFDDKAIKDYENTMAFLALSGSNWLQETSGNLDVYREFALEVQLSEMDKKLDYAINLAREALVQAREAKSEMAEFKKADALSSVVFWSAATAVLYPLALPLAEFQRAL